MACTERFFDFNVVECDSLDDVIRKARSLHDGDYINFSFENLNFTIWRARPPCVHLILCDPKSLEEVEIFKMSKKTLRFALDELIIKSVHGS